MRFTTALALLVPALAVIAAPLPSKRAAFSFALQRSVGLPLAQPAYRCIEVHPSYDQFQISDGVAGNAEAEANAVFVGAFPFSAFHHLLES
jgi:hypothetical protein